MSDRDLILAGKNLLIVDDEPLLAYDLADLLTIQGGSVIGPFHSLAEAQSDVRSSTTRIDCALLDINLGSECVWPLAQQLKDAGIPFMFVSAKCGSMDMPEEFAAYPCVKKPASEAEIRLALMSLLFG